MRYMIKSLTDKLTVAFVYLLLVEIAVSLVLAIGFMFDFGFYSENSDTIPLQNAMSKKSESEYEKIEDYISLSLKSNKDESELEELARLEKKYDKADSNIVFFASCDDGRTITNRQDLLQVSDSKFCYTKNKTFNVYIDAGQTISGTLEFNVLKDMTAKDGYKLAAGLINAAKALRYAIFVLLFVLICIAIFLLGLLMASIGKNSKTEDKEKHMLFVDKIPFDVLSFLVVAIIAFIITMILLTSAADVRETNIVLWNSVVLVLSFVISVILLIYCITLATRIKVGHVYRNTLVYRAIAKIRKKKGVNNEGYFRVPFLGKAILTIGIVMFLNIIVILFFGYQYELGKNGLAKDFPFLPFALIQIVSAVVLGASFFMIFFNLNHVRESGKKIADKDFDNVIDSHLMFGDFKAINDDLISIKDNMINALEEKSKSQEMRNELITNISHDIKTPLTSIINYTDIIGSGKCSQEDVKSYAEIINKQSTKLNELLRNLIEVSRISTGIIEVSLDAINVELFISQTVDEFSFKFSEKNLMIETHMPEGDTYINADGFKLWRVFENLFSNICKYAMPDSQVHLDVENNDGKTVISIRNISEKPITSTAEELLMRFKREDSSRHTEGNGLGLSIAKSFVEVQGGKFDIAVDGDLFKSTIIFDTLDIDGLKSEE